jgi:hypothetical protein
VAVRITVNSTPAAYTIHLQKFQLDISFELLETEDEPVYFDARQEDGFWWASPLQVYMELMVGDKRDQETAEHLKALILNHAGVVEQ